MKTKVIRMNPQQLDMEGIREAGEILKQGGLVAFPTETVYGLGGNGLDPQASAKIYQAKGRPSDNPLIIHIADMEDLAKIVKEVPESAKKLASVYWPGPLTMIFEKSDIVPYETTGGMDTVAVRMPDHPLAQALIRAGGSYVAAPSANTSAVMQSENVRLPMWKKIWTERSIWFWMAVRLGSVWNQRSWILQKRSRRFCVRDISIRRW